MNDQGTTISASQINTLKGMKSVSNTTFDELNMSSQEVSILQREIQDLQQRVSTKKTAQNGEVSSRKVYSREERRILGEKTMGQKKRQMLISEHEKLQCLKVIKSKRIRHLQEELAKKKTTPSRKNTNYQIDKQKLAKQVQRDLRKAIENQLSKENSQRTKTKAQSFRKKTVIIKPAQDSEPYYREKAKQAYYLHDSIFYAHIKKGVEYFKNYRKYAEKVVFSEEKQLNLPKSPQYKNCKTIVFDLDETLIHSNQSSEMPFDAEFTIEKQNQKSQQYRLSIRPYAKELIKKLSKYFQLIIFTASQEKYARQSIKILDPKKEYFQHILTRKDCEQITDRHYVKDLRILNRNLSDVVLVDNSCLSFLLQQHNGIPIIPYYEGDDDDELLLLEQYLLSLRNVKDVRKENKQYFQLHKYTEYEQIQLLLRECYL